MKANAKKVTPKKAVKKAVKKVKAQKEAKLNFPSKEEVVEATKGLHALTEKYKSVNLGYMCCVISMEAGIKTVRGHHMSSIMTMLAAQTIAKQI